MNKQNEVLQILFEKESMTLQEIVDAVPFGYYHNPNKYVGEILSRMVKNGTVVRLKTGVFKYRKPGSPISEYLRKEKKENPDQLIIKI